MNGGWKDRIITILLTVFFTSGMWWAAWARNVATWDALLDRPPILHRKHIPDLPQKLQTIQENKELLQEVRGHQIMWNGTTQELSKDLMQLSRNVKELTKEVSNLKITLARKGF